MTRHLLLETLLATAGVCCMAPATMAQTAPGRASTENIPAPRTRDAGDSRKSALPKAKNEIEILHALVSSTDPIKLPAREAGSIMEIAVKRGYEVKIGDIVGQIDDTDAATKKEIAERERDGAKAKADSPHELKAAKEGEAVAKENYDANVALNAGGLKAVSLFDLRRSLFELQRARAQIGVAETEAIVARHTQLAKQAQIVAAENEIRRRKLTSPVDGVVIQVFKHVGDWAQPGDAVMEIVRMNKVEVDGWVMSDEASPAEVFGKPVTIYVDRPGPSNKDKPYEVKGHITFASQVMQGSGSNRQFRVSTEIDNEQIDGFWVIQPGSEARMVIDLNGQAAPRPTPPALKSSPIFSKVEALKPAEEQEEPKHEAAPTVDVKPAEAPAAEVPAPKAEVAQPKEQAPELKEETPAPMLKVEASKVKPETTRPAEGTDIGRAASREIDVYSPRAYGSRTAPKSAPKTNSKN